MIELLESRDRDEIGVDSARKRSGRDSEPVSIKNHFHGRNPIEEEFTTPVESSLLFRMGETRLVMPPSVFGNFGRLCQLGRLKNRPAITTIKSFFVGLNNLDHARIGRPRDTGVLTKLESGVIALMCIITPDMTRLVLIERDESSGVCIPIVKPQAFDQPIPI